MPTSLAQSQALQKEKSLAKKEPYVSAPEIKPAPARLQTIPYTPPSQEAKTPVSLVNPKLSPAAPSIRKGAAPGEVVGGFKRPVITEQ